MYLPILEASHAEPFCNVNTSFAAWVLPAAVVTGIFETIRSLHIQRVAKSFGPLFEIKIFHVLVTVCA